MFLHRNTSVSLGSLVVPGVTSVSDLLSRSASTQNLFEGEAPPSSSTLHRPGVDKETSIAVIAADSGWYQRDALDVQAERSAAPES